MATRAELLRAREELHIAIHAAEEWQDSYKANQDTFRQLLVLAARLETASGEYLHELATRALDYVDWSRLPEPIKADSGPVFNNDDPVWKREETILTAAVIDIITDLVAIGAVSGEALYGYPAGYAGIEYATLDVAIQNAARWHTAQLVSRVTETSRDLIRQAVAKSISMGEDVHEARLRILEEIDNPIRAELIAQTEPVNAYQTGLKHYAKSTGAKTKTWDGLSGACQICSPLIGKTIPIDDLFQLPNGRVIDRPAGHPRCRCSLIYDY
ncbi:phage minor head protein [Pseudarthrobacter sp902506025]|uniref:phage minor head protein n=1 Tax=Pseudarthrobacter sp. 902506025 TaxID=3155291 RepID=UPI00344F29B5